MLHEALLTLFRNRPELAPELLSGVLGVELPAYTEVRIDSADLVAAWAAEPIPIGGGSVFRALVIGPRGVPVISSAEQASGAPELAVLSAMAHGQGDVEIAVQIALSAAGAMQGLHPDRRALYSDLVMAALSEAARKALEMLPQGYEFQYEPYRRAQLKSKAEGKTEAVLDFLDARGIAVSDEQRARILECDDPELLSKWVRRAATVTSADELFVD